MLATLMIGIVLVADVAPTAPLEVRGNRVLLPGIYVAAAHVGGPVPVDQAGADILCERVLGFLRAAGYTLARAEAFVADQHIVLVVDEGHLDKVVIHGRAVLATLGARFELAPPGEVFNGPWVEAALRRLAVDSGLVTYRWELIRPGPATHVGPQVGEQFLGEEPLGPSGYELHVFLVGVDWETGVGADVAIDTTNARIDTTYRGDYALRPADRWQLGFGIGATYFRDLARGRGGDFRFSYAAALGRYYSPPVFVDSLRGLLEITETFNRKQRRDLLIPSYSFNGMLGSANLDLALSERLNVTAGVGTRYRALFDVSPSLDPRVGTVRPVHGFDPIWQVQAWGALGAADMRLDRRHEISLDVVASFLQRGVWAGELRYDGGLALGWNDVLVRLAGAMVGGSDRTIAEAIPMSSRYLRGVFAERYAMKRVGSFSAEFRLSLARDLLKVGAFTDLAVFSTDRPMLPSQPVRLGLATGPGIHALILDTFQLNLYFSFGVITDGTFDQNAYVSLAKAF